MGFGNEVTVKGTAHSKNPALFYFFRAMQKKIF